MIERKEITMDAQPVFREHIRNQVNSTYNFTNMFMWSGGITYGIVEGCLVLFFQGKNHPVSVSYPLGNGNRPGAICKLSAYIREQELNPVFRNLTEDLVLELEGMFPGCFHFVEDRNAADYIYETEKMISLPGKKLHSKRNHLNYFKNNFKYSYRSLTEQDMPACMELFDRWVDEKEDLKWLGGTREATARVLDNFSALPVKGGGIYLEDELVAFTVGEAVSSDTVLVHLEYAADYRGLFNVICSEFCANEWAGFTFVNREEDMGLPGLRQAKLAYRPANLLRKFNAVQIKPLL